jgi:hypothetical protein
MQNSIEDHDLLSLIEDLPMSVCNPELWHGLVGLFFNWSMIQSGSLIKILRGSDRDLFCVS